MTTKNPLITVIVPYKNARHNLKDCAESLLNQDFVEGPYEIIMIDNNSTDGGTEILSEYDDRLLLLKETAAGSYSARNTGIMRARAEIIAFTDSDCVADKYWLSRIYNAFSPEIQMVAGEIYAYRSTTEVEKYYEKHMCQKINLSYESPYAVTANVAIKKSLFSAIGLFTCSDKQTGDVELSWRAIDNGYRIHYACDAVIYHKNIKTKWNLFKKIFIQGFHAPQLVKKYYPFLRKQENLRRINLNHYKMLLKNCAIFILPYRGGINRQEALFEIIYLIAKKLGLLCGSLRFGFLYL